MRFTTTVGMLLLSRSKRLNEIGCERSQESEFDKSEFFGGGVSCFKEAVDKGSSKYSGDPYLAFETRAFCPTETTHGPLPSTPIPFLSR
jgi:hypothetical protein